MNIAPRLLWLDCSAGASVGVVITAFHPWFSNLYALPASFVLFMGLANVLYALFSFSLARRRSRPHNLLIILVVANLIWGLLCLTWLWIFWQSASVFGLAQLFLEAFFVAGLGCLEWRYRSELSTRP